MLDVACAGMCRTSQCRASWLAAHPPRLLCPCCCRSIGAPESTLELEVRFDSLAELEAFWSAIPQQQHKVGGLGRVSWGLSVASSSSSAAAAQTGMVPNPRTAMSGTYHAPNG